MLQKIHWLYPWRIRHDIRKNYYGHVLSHYVFAELMSGKRRANILLPEEVTYFKTDGHFYGFAEKSILKEVEVVPNEKLKFDICSCINSNNKTHVEILRVSSTNFRMTIYSPEYNSYHYYSPKKEITEILNEEQLQEKLQSLEQTIEVYPFILPFGNCFSITNF